MNYYDILSAYKNRTTEDLFKGVSKSSVEHAIHSENVDAEDFASLLSPAARGFFEEMAHRAHELTIRNFGRTVQLYTPLYLSNYCDNQCIYCGFNSNNDIKRKKLNLEEVEEEAKIILSTGLKHILILTGESRTESPVSYIKDCVKVLKKYFDSVSIEIYALTESEYAELVSEGVDGLTIYQEAYDENIYRVVHPVGPKKDYRFRLDAPERGARAGMRSVSIGALFGLNDWRKEAYLMGLHAEYLQDSFPDVEIGASIPRIRPHAGSFHPMDEVSDENIAQVIIALRIFLPRLALAVSTRENPKFRENIINLGITRMSAGSTTYVGGRILNPHENNQTSQFEISDRRSVADIKEMLEKKGYQPVFKDWI